MGALTNDCVFVTWSDAASDREDATYFLPSVLDLERKLVERGARPIGSVVDVVTRAWKPGIAEHFEYIDIGAVDTRTGSITPSVLEVEEAPSRARQVVRQGDLIVSSVRPDRGAVARIPDSLDGAVASTGFFVLRPKKEWEHARDSLYLYLISGTYRRQAARRASSSMYPVLNADEFRAILVPDAALLGLEHASSELAASDRAFREASLRYVGARDAMARLLEELL